CFRRSSHPKTVNGDAIYCVAVKRCRRSRKTGFSTFRNRVRRGRQSRYGKSPDDSPHDSPATLH
ncbi:hypothetical protein CQA81_30300, partial [Klebsiella pneumoniae]